MNIEQKAVREKLAEAGKKFDGHVTHGSLNEQMEVVLAALQSAVAEEREECAKIPRRIAPSAGACINEIENAIRARGQKETT